MAALRSPEIKLGKRLGKGGSSSVYDVTGFVFSESPPADETPSIDKDNHQDEPERQQQQEQLRHALWTEHQQHHGQRYVLKRLSKGLQSQLLEGTSKYARACAINMVLEAQFLRSIGDHPNIVKLHGMGTCEQDLFLLLTHLPESMEQRIEAWRKHVKKYKRKEEHYARQVLQPKWKILCRTSALERQQLAAHVALRQSLHERLAVARDIAAAVSHLHQRGILYRDLKTSNLGFDEHGVVQLFDFGISRFLPCPINDGKTQGDLEDSFAMSRVGTKMFMAPEIAAKQDYNTQADVYSYGVLLWQLLALSTPRALFDNPAGKEPVSFGGGGLVSFHTLVSPNAEAPFFQFPMCPCWPMYIQSLLRRIIQRNPASRPTMAEVERKLQPVLDKLARDIHRHEEVLHSFSSSHGNTNSSHASSEGHSKKHKLLPFLFGRGGGDDYGRQKTFEIDYENERD